MSEDVNTGGLVRFKYDRGSEAKLSDSERNEIRDAYSRADERKRREKLQRMIIWMVVALVVIVGIGYFILK